MLNYDRLKELNAMPEELLKPYQLVNMAVPKELWDCLVRYQIEVGKGLTEACQKIDNLPTWENVGEEISKPLGRMSYVMRNSADTTASRLTMELQMQMKNLRTDMISQMNRISEQTKQTLQARDLSPIRLKLKWAVTNKSCRWTDYTQHYLIIQIMLCIIVVKEM